MYLAHANHKAAYFQARYQGSDVSLEVDSGIVLAGNLPPRVLKVIQEWRVRHKQELLEDWERVKQHELPQYIQ